MGQHLSGSQGVVGMEWLARSGSLHGVGHSMEWVTAWSGSAWSGSLHGVEWVGMEWVTAWSGSQHGVGHIVVAGLTLITSVGYKSYHCVRWPILGPTRTPGRTLLQLQPYACPSSFIYNFILLFSNNLLSDTPYRSYYS